MSTDSSDAPTPTPASAPGASLSPTHAVRAQRALRLAMGAALCIAISFGLALPVPMLAPVMAVFLLASLNRRLTLKATLVLLVTAALTTGSGLLLIPVLRYYPFSGVLLVSLCLFLAFRFGLRGGNNLVVTFAVIGLTMIPSAGTADYGLAVLVVGALLKGLLVAVLVHVVSHEVFPESAMPQAPPATPRLADNVTTWLALRAVLVVLPTFIVALSDPTSYLPIILAAVGLGRQSCTTTARGAARELVSSTLFGGVLAILFWCALSLFAHLWMFFLWMLLFGLFIARKLYSLSTTNYPPSFWQNVFVTLIILLGQSVQDSMIGKDVYRAFAVRLGLLIAVSLYACLVLQLLDQPRRLSPQAGPTESPLKSP